MTSMVRGFRGTPKPGPYAGDPGAFGASERLLSTLIAPCETMIFVLPPEYAVFRLEMSNLQPVTDNTNLLVRVSTDGATFLSGAVYNFSYIQNASSSAAPAGTAGGGSTSFGLCGGVGNAANRAASGQLTLYNTLNSNVRTIWHMNFTSNSGADVHNSGGGAVAAVGLKALMLFYNTNGIASGEASLYGMRRLPE